MEIKPMDRALQVRVNRKERYNYTRIDELVGTPLFDLLERNGAVRLYVIDALKSADHAYLHGNELAMSPAAADRVMRG